MRILAALTYYRPHISGLTTYAERLSEALAARGHEVTVLTSRYDADLPLEEERHGVRVLRVGVLARLGKGVVMPAYARRARALVADHDVAIVSYPITPHESDALVAAARAHGVPVVVAYQCDLELGGSLVDRGIQAAVEAAGRRLLRQAARVLVLSQGYADTSPLLRPHLARCVVQPPPVTLRPASCDDAAAFRRRHAPGADVVIGVAARVAAEKGLEYLLAARTPLLAALGRVRLVITGAPGGALGERRYWSRVAPRLAAWNGDATFTGRLSDDGMAAFFGACDVTCLPSVNRTESFGLVQVESLLCGTPVVASDLPGIRDAVARTGMGRLVPPRDPAALAAALVDVVHAGAACVRPRAEIARALGVDAFVEPCERLLLECARPPGPREEPREDELARLMRLHVQSVPPFRALVRAVESLLVRRHAPAARHVLDLGCGDGQFAGVTLPTPVRYGLDPDHASCARARRTGVFEQVLAQSADRIPLANEACGLVLANSVLEHIPALDGPLAEIRRVLAPGGWLVVTAPSHRFADGFGGAVILERARLPRLAAAYRDWFNRRSAHHHLDSAETWRGRLERAGFLVDRHEYYLAPSAMFWFDLLHYVSAPSMLARRWLGRWHWAGSPIFTSRWTAALARLARRVPDREGAYVFLLARKS
jgi:glycosyltransferase involved in cell wall biosynthesis/SAM-dependent methyltransferase